MRNIEDGRRSFLDNADGSGRSGRYQELGDIGIILQAFRKIGLKEWDSHGIAESFQSYFD